MSPLPTRMADHWWQRPGRSPGRLQYHWHVLFHGQPEVHRLAELAQRKLAGVPGLDPVPLPWLHLTTLIVGFADEVSAEQVADMTSDARHRLAGVRPIPVTLGRVYYHPEAIVLPPEPLDALTPILDAVTAATRGGCRRAARAMPTPTRGCRISRSPTATAQSPWRRPSRPSAVACRKRASSSGR